MSNNKQPIIIITPDGCESMKLGTLYKKNTGKKTKSHTSLAGGSTLEPLAEEGLPVLEMFQKTK